MFVFCCNFNNSRVSWQNILRKKSHRFRQRHIIDIMKTWLYIWLSLLFAYLSFAIFIRPCIFRIVTSGALGNACGESDINFQMNRSQINIITVDIILSQPPNVPSPLPLPNKWLSYVLVFYDQRPSYHTKFTLQLFFSIKPKFLLPSSLIKNNKKKRQDITINHQLPISAMKFWRPGYHTQKVT